MSTFSVSRAQVLKCLRDHGWNFVTKGKRQEIYRKTGNANYLSLPVKKHYPESILRPLLRGAGLNEAAIEDFFKSTIKSDADAE